MSNPAESIAFVDNTNFGGQMEIKQSLEDQLEEVETSYRELVQEIENQLGEMEKRLSRALNDVQDQLPSDAADVMKRIRLMNGNVRKRLASLSEQALDAAKEAIDALAETTGRLTGASDTKKKDTKKKDTKTASKKSATKGAGETKSSARASQSSTKAELYAEATGLEISGRSSMTKAQLVKAINKAS
jgi:hypothetical protein